MLNLLYLMEVPKPEYRVSDVKPSLQMMARLLMPKTDYLVFSIEADRKKKRTRQKFREIEFHLISQRRQKTREIQG